MFTHSTILAWRIPWTEEPGRLPSMELQRVGHDLATKQQQLTNPAFHTRQFINSFLPSCICTMFNSLQRAQHAFSYYASQKMAFGIDLEE